MRLSDSALEPIPNDSIIKLIEDGEDELVLRHNILLIYKLALDIKRESDPLFDDILQEGCKGLLHAITKYDVSKGACFATYATLWIKQRMKYLLAAYQPIRLPQNAYSKIRKIYRFKAKNNREPTVEEVMEVCDISRHSAEKALIDSRASYIAMDGVDKNLFNPLQTSFKYPNYKPELIKKAMKCLSERERHIIIKRFGLDGEPHQPLEALSQTVKVTRERVRQIQNGALEKMERVLYEAKEER